MPTGNFFIRTATRVDYNLIRYGLKRFYWPNDPLSIGWNDQKTPSLIEFQWTMTNVVRGKNLIAFNNNNTEKSNFVGFIINNKWSADRTDEILSLADANKDNRLLAIGSLYKLIEDETNIYKKFNVDNVFLINNVGVHPDFYRKKLGTQLVEEAFNRAKEVDCRLVVVYTTGVFSTTICEKVGMKRIAQFKYSKLIDKFKKDDVFNSYLDDKEFSLYVKEMH